MEKIKLDKRLSAAASFCRQGSFIADVGTDHAYLPLWLWERGMIRGGVVSDVNEGPITRAKMHINERGASKALSSELCDGLSSLEGYAPEDIFILGMGGELIARIIDGGRWTRKEGVRLILQPMTHADAVRRYLISNGYEIIDEALVKEDKIYQIIVAEYSGIISEYDEFELAFGRMNIERRSEIFVEFLVRMKDVMEKRMEGKRLAGADCDLEIEFLRRIGELI